MPAQSRQKCLRNATEVSQCVWYALPGPAHCRPATARQAGGAGQRQGGSRVVITIRSAISDTDDADPVQAEFCQALDDVQAEEESRAKIAAACRGAARAREPAAGQARAARPGPGRGPRLRERDHEARRQNRQALLTPLRSTAALVWMLQPTRKRGVVQVPHQSGQPGASAEDRSDVPTLTLRELKYHYVPCEQAVRHVNPQLHRADPRRARRAPPGLRFTWDG